MSQENELIGAIITRMMSDGSYDSIQRFLRDSLSGSGWYDALLDHARNQTIGSQRPTVDEVSRLITPKAKESVPEEVMVELRRRVKEYVEANVES
ncbi:hypothetical protein BT69DRAFT_1284098 [Atractiella rhizophila]|nr:hypothetical protein BT69DRAFT_1284098 [Atractiella rhizophila]